MGHNCLLFYQVEMGCISSPFSQPELGGSSAFLCWVVLLRYDSLLLVCLKLGCSDSVLCWVWLWCLPPFFLCLLLLGYSYS